jgi:hypothetical protein
MAAAVRMSGRLSASTVVQVDRAQADALRAGRAQAHQVHLVAALGERSRLTLDAGVQVVVRVMDHADAQRARHAAARSPS